LGVPNSLLPLVIGTRWDDARLKSVRRRKRESQ
jgi:hypothetical protein